MLRTGQSPAPSMRRSSSASTPDSHRLAAVSLSLGYVVVPSFRWSSAPELLDAHSAGIAILPRISSDANTRWAAYEQQESLTPPPSTWCSVAWRSRGRGVKHATRSRAAVCVCLSCAAGLTLIASDAGVPHLMRGRCRRSSLRSPVTSKLLRRHAMLHQSYERTSGRPAAQWSRLEAGRLDDLGPKSLRGVRMKTPPIVSPKEWEAARRQLLVKEKELTRARDALA